MNRLPKLAILWIVYGILLTMFLIITGIKATKKLHSLEFKDKKKWNELTFCKKIEEWLKLVYKLKSIYVSGLIHIYDITTDTIIVVEWWKLAKQQWNSNPSDPDYPNGRLSMLGVSISALLALSLYRIVSAYLIYKYTNKWYRVITQLLDLDIFRAVYIAHYLERDSVCDLQRWLQKLEAIFESSPQAILQIVFLTLSDDGINFRKLHSVIVVSSLMLSIISVAQRFTNDDKVFFDVNKGGKAFIKLYRLFECKGQCINIPYLQRYIFRITDVFSRILSLALIWIVFPRGGFFLMGIIGVEGMCIVKWAYDTNEYNKLQLLAATYFSEFIESNDSIKQDTKLLTAKYAFWRRIENLCVLVICISIVFFDKRYFNNNKQWIIVTKILILLAIITNSISSCLYFFTHHILSGDLTTTKGTNERDLIKVIQNGDDKTFLEMMLFGFNLDIVKTPIYVSLDENEVSVSNKNISYIEKSITINNSISQQNNDSSNFYKEYSQYFDLNEIDEKSNIEVSDSKFEIKQVELSLNLDSIAKVKYNQMDEKEGNNSNNEIALYNLLQYSMYEFRNRIIESKEEKLIISYLTNNLRLRLMDWGVLLSYYIPSSVDALKFMLHSIETAYEYYHEKEFDWLSNFGLNKQKQLIVKYYNKLGIISDEELIIFYLGCIDFGNKYNFHLSLELLSIINYTFEIKDLKITVNKKTGRFVIPKGSKVLKQTILINHYFEKIKITTESEVYYLNEHNQIIHSEKNTQMINFSLSAYSVSKYTCIVAKYMINNYCFAKITNTMNIKSLISIDINTNELENIIFKQQNLHMKKLQFTNTVFNLKKSFNFNYISDFDENGLLHFLGTNYGTDIWKNPCDIGKIRVSSSRLAKNSLSANNICGKNVVRCLCKAEKNNWFMVDFINLYLNVTDYSLRHYSTWNTECLRNWYLEGSNNLKHFRVIKQHKNDSGLDGRGSTHTWKVSSNGKRYRAFRIRQYQRNSNKHWYLVCSGIEFYGQVFSYPN